MCVCMCCTCHSNGLPSYKIILNKHNVRATRRHFRFEILSLSPQSHCVHLQTLYIIINFKSIVMLNLHIFKFATLNNINASVIAHYVYTKENIFIVPFWFYNFFRTGKMCLKVFSDACIPLRFF